MMRLDHRIARGRGRLSVPVFGVARSAKNDPTADRMSGKSDAHSLAVSMSPGSPDPIPDCVIAISANGIGDEGGSC